MVRIPRTSRLPPVPRRSPAWLLLGLMLALGWPSSALRGGDWSLAQVAKDYVGKALGSAKGWFRRGGEAEAPPTTSPDDLSRERALMEARKAIFFEKDGACFTQSRWGGTSAPYQLEGLVFVELPDSPSNAGDPGAGIDRRVTYEIRVSRHRIYEEPAGWGAWQNGSPPHLDSITLVRRDGQWEVSVSPVWAYSLQ